LATLPLLVMVGVIEIFVYPQAWVEHLLWASVLVFLLTQGPGVFSVDYLIEHWRAPRRPGAGRANRP
jgi:putative oxidoreductase